MAPSPPPSSAQLSAQISAQKVPLWRDDRVLKIVFQVVIAGLVASLYGLLYHNFRVNLQKAGLEFSFRFLTSPASFSIGETPIAYDPQDSYARAILVGLINTLRVILVGFGLTTIVGVMVGIASFSENWLLRKLSLVYVEITRNIPLLLQLLFWYFIVFLSLPKPREPLQLPGPIFMSKAGLNVPWPQMDRSFWVWLGLLGLMLILAIVLWQWQNHERITQGSSGNLQQMGLILLAIAAGAILVFGFSWQGPQSPAPGRVEGGLKLSVEYASVLVGLVVYTGAFIAEIVRGGIQSVSKGQWEAARSLGLQPGAVMRLVVFPQALRVIIPPLNSQYMNLAKNSSLALAIGYPDLFSVSSTSLNQTGRPLEVFLLIMAAYLSLNVVISLVMNRINRLVQIQER